MSELLVIQLNVSADKLAQLKQLQHVFAQACNTLASLAGKHACWNRVALHHFSYHTLREQYPLLGSQMVCNAIYSVCRVGRTHLQKPDSAFNMNQARPPSLPQLYFAPTAPVYFDRHTLSIKQGMVSMFTLKGRMRFNLSINEADEARFKNEKLREIVLASDADQYQLSFLFASTTKANAETTQTVRPEYEAVLPENPAGTPAASIGKVA